MTKQKVLIPIIAIVSLIVMIIAMAGGFDDKISPNIADKQAHTLESKTLEPYRYVEKAWLPANLIAKQNTQVASRILANVTSVNVRAGDMVQAGDVIAELDNQDLKAQVRQIAAQVEAVSAQLRHFLQKTSPSLVQRAEDFTKKLLFVPVSATGMAPDENNNFPSDKIRPMWCEVPLLATLAKWGGPGHIIPSFRRKPKPPSNENDQQGPPPLQEGSP